MKFSIKIQQDQTDAVNAVVDVFKGQVRPAQDTSYFFDPGRLVPVKTKKAKNGEISLSIILMMLIKLLI